MSAARERRQKFKLLSQREISKAFREHWNRKRDLGSGNDPELMDAPDSVNEGMDHSRSES